MRAASIGAERSSKPAGHEQHDQDDQQATGADRDAALVAPTKIAEAASDDGR